MCLARAKVPGFCSALSKAGRLKPAMPAVPAWSSRRRESWHGHRHEIEATEHHRFTDSPKLNAAARILYC